MRKILPWVNINGNIIPQKKAKVSAFDCGVQYGYGVFTTVKVREGIPLFFEKHRERLQQSLRILSFPQDSLAIDLKKSISEVIRKNSVKDGGVRITITKETIIIYATTINKGVEPVSVITVSDERDVFKTLKITYRVPHILAQEQAQKRGAQDALFVQENTLIESTYANIYSCNANGNIITPPIANKGLNGISRQVLREELLIQEQEISQETDDPMVLVSSLSMRVVEKINRKQIKQNKSFVTTIQNALDAAEKAYMINITENRNYLL